MARNGKKLFPHGDQEAKESLDGKFQLEAGTDLVLQIDGFLDERINHFDMRGEKRRRKLIKRIEFPFRALMRFVQFHFS